MRNRTKKIGIIVCAPAIMALAMLGGGCGSKGGGAAPMTQPGAAGFGKVAAVVKLTPPAGRVAGSSAATVTVSVSVSGVYSVDDTEFTPVTTSAVIDVANGSAKVSMLSVPIGVNHLLTVFADWGSATETLMSIIPGVSDGAIATVTVDPASTVAAEAAIYKAGQQSKRLADLASNDIAQIVAAVESMAANGISYSGMTPEQVFSYMAGMGVPASVAVSPATATVMDKQTYQFSAALLDVNNSPISGATFTWSFSDDKVGSVSVDGLFTAKKQGAGIITASSGVLFATASVTVVSSCALDSECGDGDALTLDSCVNPGTNQAACVNTAIACNTNSDCDDNNSGTLDVCSGGGAIGASCSNTQIPNQAPTATAFSDGSSGIAPLTVSFAGGCLDSDGTCASYAWDFGDGGATSAAQNPNHIYTSAGSYTATLAVTDDDGGAGTAAIQITVAANQPPAGTISSDGAVGVVTIAKNFTGACSDADGTCVSYLWDFGDGGPTSSLQNPSHMYASAGTFIVTLTVMDSNGATSQNQLPINILPASYRMAPGGYHTCAVTSGGGVKCWGDNSQGQLGDGTTTSRLTPGDVTSLTSGVIAVAGSGYDGSSVCALTAAGGVKCWGGNLNGQLGDGTTVNRATPVDVTGLTSGVTAIAAAAYHSCAITAGGGVKCWGYNLNGQLGNGTTVNSATPVDVNGLTSGVAAISTGAGHTCAVTTGGSVKCWGSNDKGQLGNGTTVNSATPVDVSGLASGVAAIASGLGHTCAVTTGGGVKCWGENSSRQLGDGTTANRTTPGDVTGLTSGAAAITAGTASTCALTTGGGVKCWGANGAEYSGDSSVTGFRTTPGDISGLTSGAVAIAAGSDHACALLTGGGMKCWGSNEYGQLGDGKTINMTTTPAYADGLASGVTAIDSGAGNHTCALTGGGGVKCWGDNSYSQLGDGAGYLDGTFMARYLPADVTGLTSGIAAVSVGKNNTCALTTGGGVKCWGSFDDGWSMTMIGASPVDITGLTSGVAAISAAQTHACVLTTAGGVKCWGLNGSGQLGDGTTTDRFTPADVSGLTSGVAAIEAGSGSTCALTSAGGVKCWGENGYGQLGDGTTIDRLTPVDVSGLTSGVTAISVAGFAETNVCALTTSGGMKCWGRNGYGQLGDGTTTDRYTPVDVSGLTSGVTAISAGSIHTCALLTGGSVKCWGNNYRGQLGDGTTADKLTPADITGMSSGVTSISAGYYHTCAITTGGGVKCWGLNAYGQLGVNPGWIPVDVAGF